MLKIKLARFGKRHQPFYRIVINEARDKRDGSYVEKVGHYAPTQEPKILEVDLDRYDYWVNQGAQPTQTVAHLIERFKSGNPFPAKKEKLSKKAKAKAEEAAQQAKEATKEEAPVAEAPTETKEEATQEA